MVAVSVWASAGGVTAEPPPAEAFVESGPISSPSMSPDGKHLAVSADLGDGNYALVVYRIADMQSTIMLRLPRYELPVRIAWVSDRRLVIGKGRKLGSLEEPVPMGEIIATDLDGGNQRYVYGYQQSTRNAGLERGFGYIEGLPSRRNGHFYMRRLSPDSRHSMLYDVDATTTTHRLIADIDMQDLRFVLDRDGVAQYAYGTDDDDTSLLFRRSGNGWTPLTQIQANWRPFTFADQPGRVYGWYSDAGGPAALVSSDPDGQQRSVLASDPFYDVDDLQWGPVPAAPFAARLGPGQPTLRYFAQDDAQAQLHRSLSQTLAGQYVDFVNFTEDGSSLLLKAYSDRDAGAWYIFNRPTNTLKLVIKARNALPAAQMSERRMLRFQARDGLALDGVLTVPAAAAKGVPLPMILLPHGGPHADGDGWAFDTDAQFLASRGYLVLQVNYRGGQGRGPNFERAGYRQWGERIQDDLVDGVRWAIAQGLADPTRICSYGASFGAYAAMMVQVKAPEMFRCAVGMAGIYDLQMMYSKGDINRSDYGLNYLERAIGRDPADLAAHSPVALAERIKAPVLLVHGEEDERAPFAQAKSLRAALTRSGNAPQWMAVPKEGHGFYKEANQVAFYRTLEQFLASHLGNPAAVAGALPVPAAPQ
ncbi:prolyl oligopeptidase family serine peptidase [Xanthomonas cassavae CFBP 4642]|uniref:Prolyl oligopeptidase family serine peptidase n=2 Tax=Xanthomonas cassavae TaxID=56450 RepID=A0ABS8HFK4_9XANT|nr:prolyl oligopeptidase family serine peptidase [Xanthomonas cassavae]MCC4619447.1 prolyl oligopeptidase family serine peptidase [Xanthomonas cassavae CFBP 4642]